MINFNKNSKKGDGLDNNCKICNKKRYINKKKCEKTVTDIKKCHTCSEIKHVEEFYNRIGSVDGKSSQCKICMLNQYNIRSNNRTYIKLTSKECINCSIEKDVSEFGKKIVVMGICQYVRVVGM